MDKKQKRIHVFLDLDNTLISSEPAIEFPFEKEGIKEKSLKFRIHNLDDYYIVFERPGLQNFLDYLFAYFDVSVWTAASKDYALYMLKKVLLIKPERKLHYFFFSYHCKISDKKGKCIKDLEILWNKFILPDIDKNNTIIIDDLPDVCEPQMNLCIPIKPFKILDDNSENDNELEIIKEKLELKRKGLDDFSDTNDIVDDISVDW